MPLMRDILAASVLHLKAQLESSRREGKMVKPEGASGISASCSANGAPQRHLHVGGVMCAWRGRLKVTAPNVAFTLKCKRNCSSLKVAESRFWHSLPFVALPIIRWKLCSPAAWMTFTFQGQAGFFVWTSKAFFAANLMCRNRNFSWHVNAPASNQSLNLTSGRCQERSFLFLFCCAVALNTLTCGFCPRKISEASCGGLLLSSNGLQRRKTTCCVFRQN